LFPRDWWRAALNKFSTAKVENAEVLKASMSFLRSSVTVHSASHNRTRISRGHCCSGHDMLRKNSAQDALVFAVSSSATSASQDAFILPNQRFLSSSLPASPPTKHSGGVLKV
jgi:hypothetical protein